MYEWLSKLYYYKLTTDQVSWTRHQTGYSCSWIEFDTMEAVAEAKLQKFHN